jgi:hypothetical protein
MNFALVNESKDADITPAVLLAIASAVEDQLYHHYGPMHQADGIPVRIAADIKEVAKDECPIVIFDDSDSPGALGYHAVSPNGRPYSRVFWKTIKENDGTISSSANSLSVTISHEALEAAKDPYVNAWVDMGDGKTEEALELCDRVENDAYEMPGTGVWVSNFLGPRAFRNGAGPYDYMGLLIAPFQIRPGGYCIRREGGPQGDVKQVFGAEYPQWKKDMKAHPASRTSKRHSLYKKYTSFDTEPAPPEEA